MEFLDSISWAVGSHGGERRLVSVDLSHHPATCRYSLDSCDAIYDSDPFNPPQSVADTGCAITRCKPWNDHCAISEPLCTELRHTPIPGLRRLFHRARYRLTAVTCDEQLSIEGPTVIPLRSAFKYGYLASRVRCGTSQRRIHLSLLLGRRSNRFDLLHRRRSTRSVRLRPL